MNKVLYTNNKKTELFALTGIARWHQSGGLPRVDILLSLTHTNASSSDQDKNVRAHRLLLLAACVTPPTGKLFRRDALSDAQRFASCWTCMDLLVRFMCTAAVATLDCTTTSDSRPCAPITASMVLWLNDGQKAVEHVCSLVFF